MQLGRHLNIEEHLLRIIEKNNVNDCEGNCSKMLSEWLDMNVHASWGELIDSIDKLMDEQEGMLLIGTMKELHEITPKIYLYFFPDDDGVALVWQERKQMLKFAQNTFTKLLQKFKITYFLLTD